ncbi:hypothetical protein T4D_14512 [Trichinella pseudospiralis]|uniref:Uncharacterized protein n=1 Tax=Trichinella pseudospiralis TaxID=6337 RepID=A0A0V1FTH4_TRIPS|nr:hypothetical protein T4D_14512 [Trichinella pseudospiralis]
MTTRRRDRDFKNEQLRSEGGRTGVEAEAEQRTLPGGLLQWGSAWEMTLRGVGTAGYGLLPAFSPVIDLIEWLDTVEDFFLVNDVPSARQAASVCLLMTKAVRRELFPPGSARDISWQELRRRLLDTYDNNESPIQLEIRFS